MFWVDFIALLLDLLGNASHVFRSERGIVSVDDASKTLASLYVGGSEFLDWADGNQSGV